MPLHPRRTFLAAATLLFTGTLSSAFAQAPPPAEAPKKEKAGLTVTVDASDAPDAAEWGEKAKGVVETWYPRVAEMLKTEGSTPPDEVTLVFKKELRVPAYAGGHTITISADWVKKHPEDLGMVVHELTHLIQHYPRSREHPNPGWLVEGIADYIRFFQYEPKDAIGGWNPSKAKYTDSYRTTARFLAWVKETYDPSIVTTLNRLCREGEYTPEAFERETKKPLDTLWDEFIKDAKEKRKGRAKAAN